MSFSSASPPHDPAPEGADDPGSAAGATWQDYVRAGRLRDALEAAPSAERQGERADENPTQLINDLLDLRGFFRAKAWSRANGLATKIAPALARVMPTFPDEVTLLRESGERLERGDAEEALTRLERVGLPLFLAEAETQRGTALVFLGRTDEAEEAFRRATEADPRHYRAITNLGNVALEAGRVDEAIAFYESALRVNENFPNAHHNLGVAYRRKGQVHKSVQAIRKAQRVGRQRDRSDAKESVQSLFKGRSGRYLKWVLWAIGAVLLYLVLQALNVI